MERWTRISLLSAMLLSATLTFVPAPAAACVFTPQDPLCTGTPCVGGDPCPVDVNEILNEAPCVRNNDCPTDDLCTNVNYCVPCYRFGECPADRLQIWVEDWSVDTDGGVGVSVTRCWRDGTHCSTTSRFVPAEVPPVPGVPPTVCFTYNPNALTNACLTPSSTTKWVPVPGVTTGSNTLCIIGDQCVNYPVPGVTTTPTPVTVPGYDGYVEVTAACIHPLVPCRVTL